MKHSAILFLMLTSAVAAPQDRWEKLPDGTLGREAEFHGVDGLAIPAYVRKLDGPGPFPVIVWMHGGKDSKQTTINMGRTQGLPLVEFARQRWVIYAADYRPAGAFTHFDYEDTVKAVEAARAAVCGS